jgi:fumarate hydratase subunit beta
MNYKLTIPFSKRDIAGLKAGDKVLISGTIHTARDQAHKRLVKDLLNNKKPPFELKNSVLYYCGPTQSPPNKVIGSCGPTTSRRMDQFTPLLLKEGITAMIGKGSRSELVKDSIRKNNAVYFVTYGGCGALLSRYVLERARVAYQDLGPEAIFALKVKDFPAIVAIDQKGRSVYGQV